MRRKLLVGIYLSLLLLFFYSCLDKEWSSIENGKYSSYLEDECRRVNALMDRYKKDSCVFVGFITDLHFSSKGSGYRENLLRKGVFNSLHVLSELTEKYNFSLVVMGGDYIQLPLPSSGKQTYKQGVDCVKDVVSFSEKINAPTFRLRGNHEVSYSGDGTGKGMTADDFYRYSTIYCDDVFVVDGKNNWSYYDDKNSFIRYVFLDVVDTKKQEVQYQWLKNDVINTIPDNYSLWVFSHIPLADLAGKKGNYYYTELLEAAELNGHDVIACVSGHIHSDWYKEKKGILYVSSLQAGFWSPQKSMDGIIYKHKKNSIEESAFDVIALDQKRREIHFLRLGLGKDRTFNY